MKNVGKIVTKQATQLLKLNGKTVVFIDWANVHGWEEKLRWVVDLKKLHHYLKSYRQIREIRFYFGTDAHPASKQQLKQALAIDFKVITKPVKYLPVKDKGIVLWKRKCDFDLEIGLDCFEMMEKFTTFIFFSGDGDFATLYKRLIRRKKQVIVIFGKGTLGKEIVQIKHGVFLCDVRKIRWAIQKKYPPTVGQGRD